MSALRDGTKYKPPGSFRAAPKLDTADVRRRPAYVPRHPSGPGTDHRDLPDPARPAGDRTRRHPTGWLSYLGPFPRRLDFDFRPADSSQSRTEARARDRFRARRHIKTKGSTFDPEPHHDPRADHRKLGRPKRQDRAMGNPAAPASPIRRSSRRPASCISPRCRPRCRDPRTPRPSPTHLVSN